MIRIAVIDDNRLVREVLTTMLGRVPDLQVVPLDGTHPDWKAEEWPQVLLLDVGLRDEDSLGVATTLRAAHPEAQIIVMDLLPVNEEIREYVNVGVAGFVLKNATFDEFIATIRAVAGGAKVLPPQMTETLFEQILREASVKEPARVVEEVRMTRREREVVDLIGAGLSNKELAQRLNIATHTVKSHVRNVMEKLTLHTRLQIAAYSHREGTT
jgi:DNA-binding NarL/FixJ family response regulator